MKITVSIDDVNPLPEWRIFGTKVEEWLFSLNSKFGIKYNLFIPTNYHNKANISDNKNWINELLDSKIFELSAHGHFHETRNYLQYGEMEFVDMNEEECIDRIKIMMNCWRSVDYLPSGWRNPGWVCQPYCIKHLSKEFKWAALHKEHNRNMVWDLKEIYGSNSINDTDIDLQDNTIMFHSHICGEWNSNIWNQKNYDQFNYSLDFLFSNFEVQSLTISEL